MSRPVTLFTGQWADLPLERARQERQELRLRRRRAGLLGRPFPGRSGPVRDPDYCDCRREMLGGTD